MFRAPNGEGISKKALGVVVGILALVGALWASGALDGIRDPELLKATVRGAGMWGPVVYVLVAMTSFLVLLLMVPVWASAALWPLPLAILYSSVAAVLASVITYGIARQVGHERIQRRIPDAIRRRAEPLEARPFLTVALLRVVLWANPLVDMLIAVSNVPFRTYFWASLVSLIPVTAGQVLLGALGIDLAGQVPGWLWLAAALAALVWFAVRRRRTSAAA